MINRKICFALIMLCLSFLSVILAQEIKKVQGEKFSPVNIERKTCLTSDGISIVYSAAGSGRNRNPPLSFNPCFLSAVELRFALLQWAV